METNEAGFSGNCAAPEQNSRFPVILKEPFFRFVNYTDDKSIALIARCPSCNKALSAAMNATSNLVTHLRRSHAKKYDEYQSALTEAPKTTSKRPVAAVTTVDEVFRKVPRLTCSDPSNTAIMDFLVGCMLPTSIIEGPTFISMCKTLQSSPHPVELPNVKQMNTIMDSYLKEKLQEVRSILSKQTAVCTTADAWSHRGRSFMGVTVHWIDSETLEPRSAALACRRFFGSHTFDRVAEIIQSIHKDAGLQTSRIAATVTDNGSNMIKAFREFGVIKYDQEEDCEEESINFVFPEVSGPRRGFRCSSFTLPRQMCLAHPQSHRNH